MPYRVLIADDYHAMREWLCNKLREEFEVVAAFDGGAAALEGVRAFDPDAVVLDLAMRPINGLDVVRSLRQSQNCPGIILITGYTEAGLREAVLAAGAHGFVVKSDLNRDLIPAVRTAIASRNGRTEELSQNGRGRKGSLPMNADPHT